MIIYFKTGRAIVCWWRRSDGKVVTRRFTFIFFTAFGLCSLLSYRPMSIAQWVGIKV